MKRTRAVFGTFIIAGMLVVPQVYGARKEKGAPLIEQAQELREKGDESAACELYRRALKTRLARKQKYDTLLALGDCAMRQRRYAQAIEYYREAESLLPRNEKARLALGAVFEESELFELARLKYQEIVDRDRKSYEANYRLGRLLLKQGMHTQAMEYFRRAVALRSSPEIYRSMSVCAERSGDIGLAVAMLRQSAQMGLDYDDFITLGRLYGQQKKFSESEETFREAIKLAPGRAEGYIYLGLLYFENGQTMPSEKLLSIAREKAPDQAVVHFFLSLIAFRHHDPVRALREIDAAESKAGTEEMRSHARRFRAFLEK